MLKKPPIKETADKPVAVRTFVYVAIVVVLFAAAGIYGHVKLMVDPNHTTGLPLVLDHLYNILVAAAMFSLFFCVGRKLLGLAGFVWDSFAEEFVFATGLGAGVFACLITTLALAGLLNRYAMGIIFLLALVFCGSQILRLLEVGVTLVSRDYSRPAEIAYILAFATVVLVMVLRSLTPPHAVDEAIYHLSSVRRFLEAGSLTPLYDIAQGNTHLLAHMLYAPCLMADADSATRLLSVGFALLTAISLYAFACRFFDKRVGYLAALAFFGAGMVVEVGITARVDLTLAGMLFLATYAMTVYLEDREQRWLWLSAVFSGISVGVKLTGFLWVAILGCLYLAQTLFKASTAQRLRHLRLGLIYSVILLALVSPWLLKNYFYFHDPFYPFASHETVTGRRSEPISYFGPQEDGKLESYFQKTKERNALLAARTRQILERAASLRLERHPLHFWAYFTEPTTYNLGEPYHTPNYLFVICPLFLLFGRDKRLVWLSIACVAFFVLMAWSSWIARYLLPLYPPLTLIAAYVVVRTTESLSGRTALAKAIPALALVLTTGFVALQEVSQLIRYRELNYVNGSLSRANFLSLVFYYPAIRYVNENVSGEAKIFMMGSQMNYDLEKPYVADTTWESTPWRRLVLKAESPEAVRDVMKAEGITHVIYSPELYGFATNSGSLGIASIVQGAGRPDYYEQWRNWTTFEEFKAKYLEPIFQDQPGRYTVYRLR